MAKLKIFQQKNYGDTYYLSIKKMPELGSSLCSFFQDLGIDYKEFDLAYEDIIDNLINYADEEWVVFLVSSHHFVHLFIRYRPDNRPLLFKAIKDHGEKWETGILNWKQETKF